MDKYILEYEKFIKDEQQEEKNRRAKRGKKILFYFVMLLFLLPTIACFALYIRLAKVEKNLNELMAALYGTHTQDTLATDGTIYSASVNTISNNSSYEVVELPVQSVVQEADPYEGYIKVCLTFDDGPSPNTDDILDILSSYGVQATFFVNCKDGYDEQYARIVEEGNAIGMHSGTHIYKEVYYDLDSFAEDLFNCQQFIYDKTGVMTNLYRFPGGSSNTVSRVDMQDCIDYLDVKNIIYFDWNVSSMDAVAGGTSTTDIVNNVLAPIYEGEYDEYVILMHDAADKNTTVEALSIIIETLADMENVVIVPIDENITPVHHSDN